MILRPCNFLVRKSQITSWLNKLTANVNFLLNIILLRTFIPFTIITFIFTWQCFHKIVYPVFVHRWKLTFCWFAEHIWCFLKLHRNTVILFHSFSFYFIFIRNSIRLNIIVFLVCLTHSVNFTICIWFFM